VTEDRPVRPRFEGELCEAFGFALTAEVGQVLLVQLGEDRWAKHGGSLQNR